MTASTTITYCHAVHVAVALQHYRHLWMWISQEACQWQVGGGLEGGRVWGGGLGGGGWGGCLSIGADRQLLLLTEGV